MGYVKPMHILVYLIIIGMILFVGWAQTNYGTPPSFIKWDTGNP